MTDLRKMNAFRDVQLAEDFKKMAELGYLDQEYTVYGIVYWKDGIRNYMISSDEAQVWEQVKNLLLQNIYPSPVKQLTKICHVPVGEEERISTEVKLALACKLNNEYSAEALQEITGVLQSFVNENMFGAIEDYCKNIEGCFSADKIYLARALIELGYIHKNITEVQYMELMQWLKYEEKNIENDIIRKDAIEKSFYTLMYSDSKGRKKLATNAQKDWIYNKTAQLMQKGLIVSPFFASTYWYRYHDMLEQVKKQHEEKTKNLMEGQYFEIVEKIFAPQKTGGIEVYTILLETYKTRYGESVYEMLQMYLRFILSI